METSNTAARRATATPATKTKLSRGRRRGKAKARKNSPAGPTDATYFRQIKQIDLLTREEEQRLARLWRDEGDDKARQHLVAANLRFVVKVAHEYSNFGCRLEDLIQEGNLGLVLAVNKFDPDRNYRLITYAVWWIRAMILSHVMRSWSLVKVGTTQGQRKVFSGLSRARRALAGELGEDAPNDERIQALAERLGVSEKDVTETEMRMTARDFSLDVRVSADTESVTHGDLLTFGGPSAEEQVSRAETRSLARELVRDALARLPERERGVIERRVLTDEPATLRVLAGELGVSRERVRQIEKNGKRRLREYLADEAPPLLN